MSTIMTFGLSGSGSRRASSSGAPQSNEPPSTGSDARVTQPPIPISTRTIVERARARRTCEVSAVAAPTTSVRSGSLDFPGLDEPGHEGLFLRRDRIGGGQREDGLVDQRAGLGLFDAREKR